MQFPTSRRFDDRAADAARLLFLVSFVLLFVVTPIAATISRQAIYSLLPVAAVLTLVAASLSLETDATEVVARALISVTALSGFCLILWAALSVIWTPFPADAGLRILKGVVTVALVISAAAVLAS